MILEGAHGALHGVERRATSGEDAPALEDGDPDARAKLVSPLDGVRTGAAMDDDGWHARGRDPVALWRHGSHRVTIRPDCKALSSG